MEKQRDDQKQQHEQQQRITTSSPEMNKRMSILLADPGNQTCADCPARRPLWVSFFATSRAGGSKHVGVFVCSSCAQHHHFELGEKRCRIKYLKMVHEWRLDDIEILENSRSNLAVNVIMEGTLTNEMFEKERILSNEEEEDERRAKFVKNKYKKHKYIDQILFHELVLNFWKQEKEVKGHTVETAPLTLEISVPAVRSSINGSNFNNSSSTSLQFTELEGKDHDNERRRSKSKSRHTSRSELTSSCSKLDEENIRKLRRRLADASSCVDMPSDVQLRSSRHSSSGSKTHRKYNTKPRTSSNEEDSHKKHRAASSGRRIRHEKDRTSRPSRPLRRKSARRSQGSTSSRHMENNRIKKSFSNPNLLLGEADEVAQHVKDAVIRPKVSRSSSNPNLVQRRSPSNNNLARMGNPNLLLGKADEAAQHVKDAVIRPKVSRSSSNPNLVQRRLPSNNSLARMGNASNQNLLPILKIPGRRRSNRNLVAFHSSLNHSFATSSSGSRIDSNEPPDLDGEELVIHEYFQEMRDRKKKTKDDNPLKALADNFLQSTILNAMNKPSNNTSPKTYSDKNATAAATSDDIPAIGTVVQSSYKGSDSLRRTASKPTLIASSSNSYKNCSSLSLMRRSASTSKVLNATTWKEQGETKNDVSKLEVRAKLLGINLKPATKKAPVRVTPL